MQDLDETDIEKLSHLCRIECNQKEKERILDTLKKVLAYAQLLQEIDTTSVLPCNQVLSDTTNLMREDQVGTLLSREKFLENAPAHTGGMIRVPPVIKFS